jgi:hypothetical protein
MGYVNYWTNCKATNDDILILHTSMISTECDACLDWRASQRAAGFRRVRPLCPDPRQGEVHHQGTSREQSRAQLSWQSWTKMLSTQDSWHHERFILAALALWMQNNKCKGINNSLGSSSGYSFIDYWLQYAFPHGFSNHLQITGFTSLSHLTSFSI